MNAVDWFIILLLTVSALNGFMAGFVRVVFGLAGSLIALVVAALYCLRLRVWLDVQFGLTDAITGFLARYVNLPLGLSLMKIGEAGQGELAELADALHLPAPYKEAVLDYVATAVLTSTEAGLATVGELLYQGLASAIANTVAFFLLFFIVRGLLHWVGAALHGLLAGSMPGVNRLAGAVAGLLQGAVVVTLIAGLSAPLLSVGPLKPLAALVEASSLAPFFLRAFYTISPWLMTQVRQLAGTWEGISSCLI